METDVPAGKSSRYHLLLLLAALLVLVLGSWYRTRLQSQAADADSREESVSLALLSEVQQLKLAFQESELESIQRVVAEVAAPAMPSIVSVSRILARIEHGPIVWREGQADHHLPVASQNELRSASGLVVDQDGYVLTSAAISNGAGAIYVSSNLARTEADLVAVNERQGLALLKLRAAWPAYASPQPIARLPRTAEWVVRTGRSQLGADIVSLTMVATVKREAMSGDWLILDADQNREQQGGPVLNLKGEIVGITVSLPGDDENNVRVLPVDRMMRVAETLKNEKPSEPQSWAGIELQDMTDLFKQYFSVDGGVLVSSVLQGSPAWKAGIKPADIIQGVGEHEIVSAVELLKLLQAAQPDSALRLSIVRNRQNRDVELRTLPYAEAQTVPSGWGIQLRGSGVQITEVLPGSKAFRAGMRSGDWVLETDNRPVTSMNQVARKLSTANNGKMQLWRIRRDAKSFYVVLQ